MNKFISSMKYIKLKDILAVFVFISMLIPSIICRIIFKIKGKKLWLICEDGKNARDNVRLTPKILHIITLLIKILMIIIN